nr:MAG TPA: hypothetical protein [Caudoviricetes sp.]
MHTTVISLAFSHIFLSFLSAHKLSLPSVLK